MENMTRLLRKAAKKILQRASVQPEESLVITTDMVTDKRIIDALLDAACELGATPISITMPTRERGDHFSEPPQVFVDALKGADVIIPLAGFSSYAAPVLEVLKNARLLGFALRPTAAQAIDWMLHVNYERMDELCSAVTKRLYNSREITITSTGGTDVTMKLGKRHVADDPGKVEKIGDEQYLPGACVDVAPLEETWQGRIVFDALLHPPIGILSSKVALTVHDGKIENIEGGAQARRFQRWLDAFHDLNMYRMCHIGIGLNPHFKKLTGLKSLDERIYGIVGTGIGTNDIPVFQGTIRAKGHTDGYMKCASVSLDGDSIIENGKFSKELLER